MARGTEQKQSKEKYMEKNAFTIPTYFYSSENKPHN